MNWLPILLLAATAFLAAAFALKLPRGGYTLLGAALLFGLAGYALQGSPGAPAVPGKPFGEDETTGALMVEARRDFFDPDVLPSRLLVTSDAFARRGSPEQAAGFARSAIAENPRDAEAWTALGNALVGHADGRLTPAALYAYGQAQRAAPQSPAPKFFLGFAMLRAGQPDRARALWAELVAKAPADAPWRPAMAERLARLDAVLAAGARQ
jgi:cytochrome c-type biogenesis protein CcmH